VKGTRAELVKSFKELSGAAASLGGGKIRRRALDCEDELSN
jgi:hypothetical protein